MIGKTISHYWIVEALGAGWTRSTARMTMLHVVAEEIARFDKRMRNTRPRTTSDQ